MARYHQTSRNADDVSTMLRRLMAVFWICRITSAFRFHLCGKSIQSFRQSMERKYIFDKIKQNEWRSSSTSSHTKISLSVDNHQEPMPRKEATIRLAESGRKATLISRTVPVLSNFSITVWEWKNSAQVVNDYWEAQGQLLGGTVSTMPNRQKPLLDPFGLVSWPGSVLAARELCKYSGVAVHSKNVVVLGAGVGLETQAAAMLDAKSVVATDIHPTTLQQLEYGVTKNPDIVDSTVTTQIVDLFQSKERQPIPSPCDLLVVADVLYNEQLASQVCRRCAEVVEKNPEVRILITDSQRFVPEFIDELNNALAPVYSELGVESPCVTWNVETMKDFEGSGVIIDEDQIYDVTVQSLWIGL